MRLSSYEPVTIPMPPREVPEADVAQRVNEIVAQIPSYSDAAAEVLEAQDRAQVRITMRENGEPLKGLENKVMSITVEDGFFPVGLIDGMKGMKAGETRHIEWSAAAVGASDDVDESSAMDATVELISLKKRVRPEMSDAWVAAHIPQCDTLEEFFARVRGQLQEKADREWESLKRERCAIALAQRLDEAPSEDELARAIEGVRENFEQACAREGKIVSEKLAELGMSEEQFDAVIAQQGALVAAGGRAVQLFADHENVKVGDDEVRDAFARSFGDDPQGQERLKQPEVRRKMEEVARYEKALERVAKKAIVVTETPGASNAQGAAPSYPNPFA